MKIESTTPWHDRVSPFPTFAPCPGELMPRKTRSTRSRLEALLPFSIETNFRRQWPISASQFFLPLRARLLPDPPAYTSFLPSFLTFLSPLFNISFLPLNVSSHLVSMAVS